MKPASVDQPTQAQLAFPLLEHLVDAGGSAKAADVPDALANRFGLTHDVRNRTCVTRDGQIVNIWRRHVRFARQKLKALGYVDGSQRGSWTLTDDGYTGLAAASPAIVVDIIRADDGTPIGARIDLRVGLPTSHLIAVADARDLSWIGANEVPLIVTSIPYHDIMDYGRAPGQLAMAGSYDDFLAMLDDVWRECHRVLIPGGRAAINVGDVLRSRSKHGNHHVLPLHASVLTRATAIGFHALTGIIWEKIGNVTRENAGAGILGKPGQPNGVITAGLEHILLLRKQGPYRRPTFEQQQSSTISKADYQKWFQPVWRDVPGARATAAHPAPFPVEIAFRLASMFSFRGDIVLDPFAGSGSTAIACAQAGRNSISTDIEPRYVEGAIARLQHHATQRAA